MMCLFKATTREVEQLRQVASAELQVVQVAHQLAQRQAVLQAQEVLARTHNRSHGAVLHHQSKVNLDSIQVPLSNIMFTQPLHYTQRVHK